MVYKFDKNARPRGNRQAWGMKLVRTLRSLSDAQEAVCTANRLRKEPNAEMKEP